MSKKFKGMQCAYCLDAVATTVDHVFSREFFLVEDRGYLPEAPACKACNDEKSRMEHCLTAVLPFGGRHDQARANLEGHVPPRLAKNRPTMPRRRGGYEGAAAIMSLSTALQRRNAPMWARRSGAAGFLPREAHGCPGKVFWLQIHPWRTRAGRIFRTWSPKRWSCRGVCTGRRAEKTGAAAIGGEKARVSRL